MKGFIRRTVVVCVCATFSVLAAAMDAGGHDAGHGGAADEEQQVSLHPVVIAADWDNAKEMVVELSEHNYEPRNITFSLGTPYKLRLKNIGGISHDMVGGTFFQKNVIALRMVSSKSGRITADDLSSVYVRPKQEIEVWFVPIREGDFSFFCSIPGHREDGMEGNIKIARQVEHPLK